MKERRVVLMIGSYPAIHKWLRHLYWDIPAFGETTNFEHIKKVRSSVLVLRGLGC